MYNDTMSLFLTSPCTKGDAHKIYTVCQISNACVAAVKSRPVLHHCVVIFFWSSGIMECTCMLFTFENGVPLMRQGASVVLHHSLLLMNSFNKTEAAVFSCRLCFLRAFLFISLIFSNRLQVNFVSMPITNLLVIDTLNI